MQIIETALSLTVDDPEASAAFLETRFGFTRAMAADGFVSVAHPDAGVGIAFLRTGLASFRPAKLAGHRADGLLIAFVVGDIDSEHARLVAAGVPVLTEPETEPWGERYSQYEDPNGLVVQLVTWVAAPPTDAVVGAVTPG